MSFEIIDTRDPATHVGKNAAIGTEGLERDFIAAEQLDAADGAERRS